MALTRSNAKSAWKYSGCSDHSVPSLSNVAMRSPSATKSVLPVVVTALTKSVIAVFDGPAFHDGSGSAAGVETGAGAAVPAGAFDSAGGRLHAAVKSAAANKAVRERIHITSFSGPRRRFRNCPRYRTVHRCRGAYHAGPARPSDAAEPECWNKVLDTTRGGDVLNQ